MAVTAPAPAPVSFADWMRGGRLNPYMRALHSVGTLSFVEAAQPAGDMSDPPTSDLVLVRTVSPGMRQRSNLGSGSFVDTAPSGGLFAIAPGVATDIIVDTPHVIRIAAFAADDWRETLEELRPGRDPFDFGRFHAGHVVAPELNQLFDLAFAAADRCDPTSRLFSDGAAMAMIAEMARIADNMPATRQLGGLAPWQVRRVDSYLRAHLAEDVAIADLAAEARLSPFHFARQFKTSMGLPPAAYQRRLRLEKAQQLLANTDQSITEIAMEVGYDNPQSLARLFRAEIGTTPGDWRRERSTKHAP